MSREPESENAYWKEVRGIALGVLRDAVEYDRDTLEALHEAIDGHSWVIYTAKAQLVLAYSPNDGYAVSELGSHVVLKDGGALNWSALAFGALYADVLDLLGSLDGAAFGDGAERAEALADAEACWGESK